MKRKLIIGSRGSDLALWQANYVRSLLEEKGYPSEIRIIKTQGDKITNLSFEKMEGKGFFTKELEDALLDNSIDIAVHSHKDLPTSSPDGLVIAGVSGRENPSELLLIREDAVDEGMPFSLKRNARTGTSSPRRKSQLLALRPDLQLEDLRGNVPTRVQKLRDGKYDAILLAKAGVDRLELSTEGLRAETITPQTLIPAPAQGVLAYQTRSTDKEVIVILKSLSDPEVELTTSIERKVFSLFEGGCQLPLGVLCEKDRDDEENEMFRMWVSWAGTWNSKPKYFYFSHRSSDGLAEKASEKMKNARPCAVFISRNPRKHDLFREVLEGNGYTVSQQALIETRPLNIGSLPDVEWVFFSSKNAVKFFFDQKPVLSPEVKFGAIGRSTADEIRKFNRRATFIGQNTDTKLIGKQFSAIAGNRKVLFPMAKGSMRSVQMQLAKKENAIDLPVYETIKNLVFRISDFGIIVFTSPSNVEAFFESGNKITDQKVVAMGDATAASLRKSGVRAHAMPVTFDDKGLLEAVFGVS